MVHLGTPALDSDIPPVVRGCLRNVRHVHTLPVLTAKVLTMGNDPNLTAADITKVINVDPALCMRILRIANSSFYGFSFQIETIHRAVVLLGLSAVKNIVIAAGLSKLFRIDQLRPHFDAQELWLHSVAVATIARSIAKKTKTASAEEAFLAGLIHDVGVVIEIQACWPEFVELVRSVYRDEALPFREMEHKFIGATHEEFGEAICKAWSFPKTLAHVAGYHHRPLELSPEERTLPSIVHVADVIAARMQHGYTRTIETHEISSELLSYLNLSEEDIESIPDSLGPEIDESRRLLAD